MLYIKIYSNLYKCQIKMNTSNNVHVVKLGYTSCQPLTFWKYGRSISRIVGMKNSFHSIAILSLFGQASTSRHNDNPRQNMTTPPDDMSVNESVINCTMDTDWHMMNSHIAASRSSDRSFNNCTINSRTENTIGSLQASDESL